MSHIEKLNPTQPETKEFSGQKFIIERFKPGDLSPEQKENLVIELTPLTGKGFLRHDIYSPDLAADVRDHVVEAPRLVILRNLEGAAVAFIAAASFYSPKLDLNFYDLGGIIVDPSLHSVKVSPDSKVSIAEYLLREELTATQVDALVLRTQSQKMFNLAAKVSDPDRDLAALVAPEAGYDTNLDGDINRQVYRKNNPGTCLYDDIETFASQAIQVEGLDWLHGDALVIAGLLK